MDREADFSSAVGADGHISSSAQGKLCTERLHLPVLVLVMILEVLSAIAIITRDDMDMDMGDFLAGCRVIVDDDVGALVSQNFALSGFDLLGYRFTGDAVKLNEEFVKNVRGDVCLAGSVASFQRLDEVRATGAWAFTIGGAFFEKKFGDCSFGEQVDIVVDYMNR